MMFQLVLAPTKAPRPFNWAVFGLDMYGTFYHPEAAGVNYTTSLLTGKYGYIYEYFANTGEISRVLFFKRKNTNTVRSPIFLGTLLLYPAWYQNYSVLGLYAASGGNLNQDINAAFLNLVENIDSLAANYGEITVEVLRDAIKFASNLATEAPMQPESGIAPVVQHVDLQPEPIKLEPSNVDEELAQIANAKQASLETLAAELSKITVKTPEPEPVAVVISSETDEESDTTITILPVKKKKKKKKKNKKAAQDSSGILTWVYNHKPRLDMQTLKQLGMSAAVAAVGGLVHSVASAQLSESEQSPGSQSITPRSATTTALLFMGTFSALRRGKLEEKQHYESATSSKKLVCN
jgi:hypothetical protein